ncbi:MAG: hypothetical protein RL662_571 [Bacteroidota bacterium]|jgi:glycosyltransferase involved in cell wall biosynthesis
MDQINNKIILATIVVYNQQFSETRIFKSLSEALARLPKGWKVELFIYDNSPINSKIEDIPLRYHYIHDKSNPGVSKAYNSAAKHASEHLISWLLLLDQDTAVEIDFFVKTIDAIAKYPKGEMFVPLLKANNNSIISPFTTIRHIIGKPIKDEIRGALSTQRYSVINSGMMISTAAFNLSGGYLDAVKMDFSDTVFVGRFSHHFDVFVLTMADCVQDLSAFEEDIEKLKKRFAIFCTGAKSCPKENLSENLLYLYVVIKRMLSLITKKKSPCFIPIFWKNYVTQRQV